VDRILTAEERAIRNRAGVKRWRRENPKKHRAAVARRSAKIRLQVLAKYSDGGPPRCQHCDCRDARVLVFDHVNDDGSQHRVRGVKFYRCLAVLPKLESFQVLCHNCNYLKELSRKSREGRAHRRAVTQS
jgi:hypothetical protein